MLSLFFQYYSKKLRRYFSSQTLARSLIAFLFFAVFLGLAFGIFLFFRESFRFIAADDFFRDALLLYTYELFLLASFVLIFASALISGIFMLFRGEGDFSLMVSPRYIWVPFWKTIRIVSMSIWPFLIIILPALIAVRLVLGLSLAGFLLSLLSVLALAVTAVLAAEALLFMVGWALYAIGINYLTLKNLSLVAALIFWAMLAAIWLRLQFIDFYDFFAARILDLPVPPLDPILRQFSVLPSHFSAVTILASVHGDWAYGSAVALTGFGWGAAAAILFYILQKKFLILWQILQEGGFEASPNSSNGVRRRASSLIRASGQLSAIFYKEALGFRRNLKGMLWLGFLLIIWAVQVASAFLLTRKLGGDRISPDAVPGIVVILQFAVAIYFVSMFVLRFAFPAFSMEKKTAWLMRSAPIDWGRIFWGKLIFYASIFSVLGVFFAVLNRGIVFLPPFEALLFFAAVLLSSLVLTVFGLGLGAIFTNFETDDPEILSTTMPGLGFTAGAILYGALASFALEEFFLKSDLFFMGLWFLLSLIIIYFFIRLPGRSLARLEF